MKDSLKNMFSLDGKVTFGSIINFFLQVTVTIPTHKRRRFLLAKKSVPVVVTNSLPLEGIIGSTFRKK